jgi:hypothetical protein
MAKISTYIDTPPPTLDDFLLGTDVNNNNATQNFLVSDLVNLTIKKAQLNTKLIKIKFNWNKQQTVSVSNPINVKYYKLGIDFDGLMLNDGVEYTLLIDRWRNQEKVKISKGTTRKSKYYHELERDAIKNNRLNEIPITLDSGQYFDFKQNNYFKKIIGSGIIYGGTGSSSGRRATRGAGHLNSGNSNEIFFVNLSFRIRVNRNGVITESESLGTIALNCFKDAGLNSTVISYAKPNS